MRVPPLTYLECAANLKKDLSAAVIKAMTLLQEKKHRDLCVHKKQVWHVHDIRVKAR